MRRVADIYVHKGDGYAPIGAGYNGDGVVTQDDGPPPYGYPRALCWHYYKHEAVRYTYQDTGIYLER